MDTPCLNSTSTLEEDNAPTAIEDTLAIVELGTEASNNTAKTNTVGGTIASEEVATMGEAFIDQCILGLHNSLIPLDDHPHQIRPP